MKEDYLIIYQYDPICNPYIAKVNKEKVDEVLKEYEETGLITHLDLTKNCYGEKIKPLHLHICKIEKEFE